LRCAVAAAAAPQALSKNGKYLGDRYVRLLHVPKQEMEEQVRLGTLAIPGAQAKMRQRMMRNTGGAPYGGMDGGAYGGGLIVDPHGGMMGGGMRGQQGGSGAGGGGFAQQLPGGLMVGGGMAQQHPGQHMGGLAMPGGGMHPGMLQGSMGVPEQQQQQGMLQMGGGNPAG
jgi:hypothetical protein